MGGEWTSRNSLTERLELWHIKRERIEDFTEAWSMRRNEEESTRRRGAMASAVKARKRGEEPGPESTAAEEPTRTDNNDSKGSYESAGEARGPR